MEYGQVAGLLDVDPLNPRHAGVGKDVRLGAGLLQRLQVLSYVDRYLTAQGCASRPSCRTAKKIKGAIALQLASDHLAALRRLIIAVAGDRLGPAAARTDHGLTPDTLATLLRQISGQHPTVT
ncbi:hypothetical protein [Streptomyces sp. NPDC059788]|uniref:hypothetical protein n=1 Tax=Streptomyces sp. NPDC059788 TaxID=3346948 RepID=UPI00365CD95A